MATSTRHVTIGGHTLPITGSNDDPYFQSIDAFAAQLAPLEAFVAEYVTDGIVLDVGANIGLSRSR